VIVIFSFNLNFIRMTLEKAKGCLGQDTRGREGGDTEENTENTSSVIQPKKNIFVNSAFICFEFFELILWQNHETHFEIM